MSALNRPKTVPDKKEVLSKAFLNVGKLWNLSGENLGEIIGVSKSKISRMYKGEAFLDPEAKDGELALLLIKAFRSLDSFLGGHKENQRKWLDAKNSYLKGSPKNLISRVDGLVRVNEYLDSIRGKV